jgi:pimeloyl-ACP methyl ester carboxylesterase
MPNPGKPPVLLLHGASAQRGTFCIPKGHSLAEYLWDRGYEPWLLDWRGSCRVTDALEKAGKLAEKRELLDFDRAARQDLPKAIDRITEVRADDGQPPQRIHAIAHCMGAGVLAQAIASGDVATNRIGRVVLLTLGLFYEPALDGKLKSQVYVLDRLWRAGEVSVIDPRSPADKDKWPNDLRKVYREFGTSWRPHPGRDIDPDSSHALCNRVSFLYGTPYQHSQLLRQIHGVRHVHFVKGRFAPRPGERLRAFRLKSPTDTEAQFPVRPVGEGVVSYVHLASKSWRSGRATGTFGLSCATGTFPKDSDFFADDGRIAAACGDKDPGDEAQQLREQFGAIPLRMYLQGSYNVRRKWAAPFVDSTASARSASQDRSLVGPAALERFRDLPSVFLVTGARNQLWHRDSIDRMYEWLTQGAAGKSPKFRKKVFADYGHQDLLWGRFAKKEVFPVLMNEGLGGASMALEVGPDPSAPGPQPTSEA